MKKRTTELWKGGFNSKGFYKKGSFGIFMSKLTHSKSPKIQKKLGELREFMNKSKLPWFLLSRIRRQSFFPGENTIEATEKRIKMFYKSNEQILRYDSSTDLLFGYYLYRKQATEYKEQLKNIFYKRYNFKMKTDFSTQYLKPSINFKIKKTAFILWLNDYLKNSTSDELLELSSLDIVVKLGEIWKNLPFEEKELWEKLADKDLKKKRIQKDDETD